MKRKSLMFFGLTLLFLILFSGSALAAEKPVYRLYNADNGEHLYTTDYNEKETLYKTYNWGYEGIAWYTATSGTPVYRLYQPGLGNHLYTSDRNEITTLCRKYGWKVDNNGAPLLYSSGSVPIYRVYNKGLNGLHHLTTDYNEYKTLPKYGWKQEGTALYATSLGEPQTTSYYNLNAPRDGIYSFNSNGLVVILFKSNGNGTYSCRYMTYGSDYSDSVITYTPGKSTYVFTRTNTRTGAKSQHTMTFTTVNRNRVYYKVDKQEYPLWMSYIGTSFSSISFPGSYTDYLK